MFLVYVKKQKRDLLIEAYYGDLNKKVQRKEEVKKESMVAEVQIPIEKVEEPENIQTEEEKVVEPKSTFLNRFIKKLGDIMESVD